VIDSGLSVWPLSLWRRDDDRGSGQAFCFDCGEKGFINKEQLFEALKMQVEEDSSGEPHNLIGHILVRLGYLPHDQAEEVLLAMRKNEGLGSRFLRDERKIDL
jgi:hypothetical protein